MWNASRSKSLQTASRTESCPHPPSAFPLGFRMSNWPASKARRVLAALERTGWRVQRQRGSHRLLVRPGWPDYEFAFHDRDEVGPRMLGENRQGDRFEPKGSVMARPPASPAANRGASIETLASWPNRGDRVATKAHESAWVPYQAGSRSSEGRSARRHRSHGASPPPGNSPLRRTTDPVVAFPSFNCPREPRRALPACEPGCVCR